MSSDNICPLPKESDTPREHFRKTSGDLDDIKQALVTTTDMDVRERILKWLTKKCKSKPNVVKEAITPPISSKWNIKIILKHRKITSIQSKSRYN